MNTSHAETVIGAVRQVMLGEQLPQHETAEHKALGEALAQSINSEDLQQIGAQTVGLVLDALTANLHYKRSMLIVQFRPENDDD